MRPMPAARAACGRAAEQGFKKVRKSGTVKALAVKREMHVFIARLALELLAVLPVGPELVI